MNMEPILSDIIAAYKAITANIKFGPNYMIAAGCVLNKIDPTLDLIPFATYEVFKDTDGKYVISLLID